MQYTYFMQVLLLTRLALDVAECGGECRRFEDILVVAIPVSGDLGGTWDYCPVAIELYVAHSGAHCGKPEHGQPGRVPAMRQGRQEARNGSAR